MGLIGGSTPLRVRTPEGVREVPRIGRNGLPQCPPDIQEVVELHARKSGRTGTMHFAPGIGWFARFSVRSNDPQLRAYQEGRAPEPPSEDVFFRVPDPKGTRPGDSIPLDIVQLGASGVKEFLEKGDTWSGRGQYGSVVEAARKTSEHNRTVGAKAKEKAREDNKDHLRDRRRQFLKIPYHRVGIDIGGEGE